MADAIGITLTADGKQAQAVVAALANSIRSVGSESVKAGESFKKAGEKAGKTWVEQASQAREKWAKMAALVGSAAAIGAIWNQATADIKSRALALADEVRKSAEKHRGMAGVERGTFDRILALRGLATFAGAAGAEGDLAKIQETFKNASHAGLIQTVVEEAARSMAQRGKGDAGFLQALATQAGEYGATPMAADVLKASAQSGKLFNLPVTAAGLFGLQDEQRSAVLKGLGDGSITQDANGLLRGLGDEVEAFNARLRKLDLLHNPASPYRIQYGAGPFAQLDAGITPETGLAGKALRDSLRWSDAGANLDATAADEERAAARRKLAADNKDPGLMARAMEIAQNPTVVAAAVTAAIAVLGNKGFWSGASAVFNGTTKVVGSAARSGAMAAALRMAPAMESTAGMAASAARGTAIVVESSTPLVGAVRQSASFMQRAGMKLAGPLALASVGIDAAAWFLDPANDPKVQAQAEDRARYFREVRGEPDDGEPMSETEITRALTSHAKAMDRNTKATQDNTAAARGVNPER